MRHETEKQIAATFKAFKPIEAYLSQKKKLADAFTALETKIAKTEEEHKAYMQKAGVREAQRLLGEIDDKEGQTDDNGLLQIRDQRDKLDATRQVLMMQQDALSAQSEGFYKQASEALSTLAGTVEAELNDEMKQAAEVMSSAVSKLYAFNIATKFGRISRDLLDIEIPSLTDGANLFKRPARYHPTQNTLLSAHWESDPAAKALHDKVREMGGIFDTLSREDRERDYANQRAEREQHKIAQRNSA